VVVLHDHDFNDFLLPHPRTGAGAAVSDVGVSSAAGFVHCVVGGAAGVFVQEQCKEFIDRNGDYLPGVSAVSWVSEEERGYSFIETEDFGLNSTQGV
jgi:hypothetical protein